MSTKAPDLLFDLNLTEEQHITRESLSRFSESEVASISRQADDAGKPPEGFYDKTAELGLSLLSIPETFGGAGMPRSVLSNMLNAEDLGKGDVSLAIGALTPLSFVNLLLDYGNEEQQEKYLTPLTDEKFKVATVALMEPRATFDATSAQTASIETTAVLSGSNYVLNGEKTMVALAEDALHILVIARSGDDIGAFIVDKDASGLSIADKLRTQASSIGQSISNANSAVSLTQIADKAMAEESNILDIVKTKLLQAATATTSSAGANAIAKDVDKLLDQINNIASQTNYNGISLLQTSAGGSAATSALTFQTGETASDTTVSAGAVRANVTGLALNSLKSTATAGKMEQSAASALLATIDTALNTLNGWRADFGSTQNQLESATRNMMTQQTNIKAAESVIRDVDYAQESANFNKQNIISQAGTYAMSQANSVQQNVLRLLQ